MSTKPQVMLARERIEMIEDVFKILLSNDYYGFKDQITEIIPWNRSQEWPADCMVTMKGRRKPRKLPLMFDFNPKRPRKQFLDMLREYGIVRIVLNPYSKLRTVLREIASTLRNFMRLPHRRKQNSLCGRSFHQHMSGARLGCAA